jgi:hypothetical protein
MSLEAMTLDGIVTSSLVGRVAIVTGAGQGIGRVSLAGIDQTVLQRGVVHLRVLLARTHVVEILPRNQRSRFIANCEPCGVSWAWLISSGAPGSPRRLAYAGYKIRFP